MKKILKFRAFLVVVVIIAAAFGCASVESKKMNLNIETEESSSLLKFENVRVTSTDSIINVEGSLRTTIRSIVPGHVDITFVSPDNEVMHTLQTNIHRKRYKSRYYEFHVQVPLVLPDESTVQIVYHRRLHNGNG
jgi:hypothetical protein